MKKTETVAFSLPHKTVEAIKRMAAEENRTRSNMVAEIIDRYIAAYTTEPAKN